MHDAIDYILSTKPAYPWSLPGVGLPALAAVAIILVFLTLRSYSGHALISRRRLLLLVTLRLLALLLAVLTAVRPSIGILEEPKIPSTLVVGVDLSESMTVKDAAGNQSRIDAVRRILERCQPTIESLRAEQNVNVVFYGFGSPDFQEASGIYDPAVPANGSRSDYGIYLNRTLERWQSERFVRAHVVIGDGADNGTSTSATAEAARWRRTAPVNTFGVGSKDTPSSARDVAISDAIIDPNPVPTKTDFVLRLRVNAYGFAGSRPPLKVQFDTGDGKGYTDVRKEDVTLAKDRDNVVEVKLQAPELPKDKKSLEVKVRVEIPAASVPGDVNPTNNVLETYMTVTKDGLRVLVVDRLRPEYSRILDALTSDQRIDVRRVDLQIEEGGEGLRAAFDFDTNAYDVLILGNVTARQLTAIDPRLPERIAERVKKQGMGLLMIGGHATFQGEAGYDGATGWKGTKAIEDILPVVLDAGPPVEPANVYDNNPKVNRRFGVVPNPRFADEYVLKLAGTRAESEALWKRLSDPNERSMFTSLSRMGTVKATAQVYAYAESIVGGAIRTAVDTQLPEKRKLPPLLVGHQIGDDNRGRVLCFAAENTYLWERLGQPKSNDGKELFARFWRQLALWLAHQETDDGAAFARPEFPRVPVGRKQKIRVGVKGKDGAVVMDPKFELKVIAPGQPDDTAKVLPVTVDESGQPIVGYDSTVPGEHRVVLLASGKTAAGEEVKADASAKFIAYAETTDEMLRTAADFDLLQKVSTASGGRFYRLEELPAYLKEMLGQPLEQVRKPRFIPDWRRNNSHGFLPSWLIAFAALLLTEWTLRRLWGLR